MNKLTLTDLDKLDQLEQTFVRAIKDETLSAELEVFLRTEFVLFMGQAINKYNSTITPTSGAGY